MGWPEVQCNLTVGHLLSAPHAVRADGSSFRCDGHLRTGRGFDRPRDLDGDRRRDKLAATARLQTLELVGEGLDGPHRRREGPSVMCHGE